jgi:anti-sigma factor RsiW
LGRSAPRLDPWLLAVAHYQALYARETLNVPEPTPASVRATERQLGAQLGRALHIPDWRARGLAFKRGQVLEFAHEPLIQLTYLPRHGKPLAYCIRRSAAADAAPAIGEAASLRLIHWQRAGYAHVVIGEADDDTLRALAATAEAR